MGRTGFQRRAVSAGFNPVGSPGPGQAVVKRLSFRTGDSWLVVARENAGEAQDSARLSGVGTSYPVRSPVEMSFATAC